MSHVLFVFIHIMIGLGLIYFYNKLPKPIMTFAVVFFTMSLLYWGAIFTRTFF